MHIAKPLGAGLHPLLLAFGLLLLQLTERPAAGGAHHALPLLKRPPTGETRHLIGIEQVVRSCQQAPEPLLHPAHSAATCSSRQRSAL